MKIRLFFFIVIVYCIALAGCDDFTLPGFKNDSRDTTLQIDAITTTLPASEDTGITVFPNNSPPIQDTLPGQIATRNVHPEVLVAFAESLIGIPYRYGATDPKVGFDCSGFITYVFNHFQIKVPRSSIDFTNVGKEIPFTEARRGDIILFTGTDSTERFVGHMGIIVSNQNGEQQFIHSTSGKAYSVAVTPFNVNYRRRFVKVIRIFKQLDMPI
jgi:cell wall-associated NlpC family hydrolase